MIETAGMPVMGISEDVRMIGSLKVFVTRKPIRNLYLSVKPPAGTVHVSAPLSVSDKAIDLFVRSKAGWIRLQQRGFHEQSRADSRQFVSGERFFYCGVAYELLVTAGRAYDLRLEGRLASLTAPTASTVTHRGAWLNEWLRRELKARVALRLPEIELCTGLHCNGWRIRNMATLWGSYIRKSGVILLNLQLAKALPACLDYVILHELVHSVVPDHGSRFVALLDKFMPDWRDVRDSLNRQTIDF